MVQVRFEEKHRYIFSGLCNRRASSHFALLSTEIPRFQLFKMQKFAICKDFHCIMQYDDSQNAMIGFEIGGKTAVLRNAKNGMFFAYYVATTTIRTKI
jgi:hypothetical protein